MILDGRVGIITGAAQGIGRAYALAVASQGASVVLADIQDAGPAAKEIEAEGGNALAVTVDVTSSESLEGMVAKTIERFGRIDFLVNNAALYGDLELTYWEDITEEDWDRVMAVNVKGMFLAAKAVAPHMTEQRSGKIINISSGTAHAGIVGALHYVTSKAGVIGFTRALARELGDFGINVNCVTPGFTMSEASVKLMRESGAESLEDLVVSAQCFKRAEQPDDLTGAIVFLASSLSDFMTGQIVNVDGGWVMH
jgi:NAD(P)-dependent dehydrogenase (short-subunit alcohol dehydrogenase family)